MKRILIICISFLLMVTTSFSETYDYQVSFDVDRSLDQNNLVLDNVNPINNDIEVTYTLSFDDIPYQAVSPETPPKEVVLVIDTSGSMDWDINGRTSSSSYFLGETRLSIVKKAAETFVNALAGSKNVKLGLVSYDYRGYVEHELTNISDSYANKTTIINTISSLKAGGGTNVGDAIRIGSEVLSRGNANSDQFFVFLTDGEPTHYSRNSYDYNFYTGTGYAPATVSYKDYAKLYAQNMTQNLTEFEKNYFVAFSNNGANKLQEIAGVIQSYYKKALTSDEIDEVYDEISYVISADLSVEDVTLTDVIPDGLTVSEAPDGMRIDGQNISYNVGPIPYVLNEERTAYVAKDKLVKIKVRASRPGTYRMDSGMISYLDFDDVRRSKTIGTTRIDYTRDPVENLKARRNLNTNGNPENILDLTWDHYLGAVSYNVYKDDILLESTIDNQSHLQILKEDEANEIFYVEAVLADGQVSGKDFVNHDTNPSILNLSVERINEKLIVSFDALPGVGYKIKGQIKGNDLVEDHDQTNFTTINNRVYYTYDLRSLEDYESYTSRDTLRFYVDGDKPMATVYGTVSEEIPLKQAVNSQIITALDSFYYSKNKDVEIHFESDTDYAEGVTLYNPLFVVELKLPKKITATPLEFSYSTLSALEDGVESGAIVTRSGSDDVTLYVALTDYQDGILPEGKNISLKVNFGVAYDSEQGVLKQSVLDVLRTYKPNLEAYQIDYQIRSLLQAFYSDATTDIDEMIEVKSYMMYNTVQKAVEGLVERDETIGITSGFIKLNNKADIKNEF